MIINLDGQVVDAFWDTEGVVYKYKEYSICLYYTEDQIIVFEEMKYLQSKLKSTDYKAVKYSEGYYTEEEYAPIKKERQEWRDRWNELNNSFVVPSITDEEAQQAVNLYLLNKARR